MRMIEVAAVVATLARDQLAEEQKRIMHLLRRRCLARNKRNM
jgi:hypothetical protein